MESSTENLKTNKEPGKEMKQRNLCRSRGGTWRGDWGEGQEKHIRRQAGPTHLCRGSWEPQTADHHGADQLRGPATGSQPNSVPKSLPPAQKTVANTKPLLRDLKAFLSVFHYLKSTALAPYCIYPSRLCRDAQSTLWSGCIESLSASKAGLRILTRYLYDAKLQPVAYR